MLKLMTRLRADGVRLSLDGDTLRCLAPKGALAPALREELTRRKGELIAFLRETAAGFVPQSSIVRQPRNGDGLPLSFAQQRLWLVDQMATQPSLYNVPAVLHLRGLLDEAALERALAGIVRRHESLRTTFRDGANGPLQFIHDDAAFALGRATAADEDEARRIATAELCRGFNLGNGPLFRATLIRIGAGDHVLALIMHHIVSDGWSMAVLLDELGALYESFREGLESPLPEVDTQYADFAAWQRASAEAGALEAAVAYWQRQLGGARELLELPADRPRPAVQSNRGAKTTHTVAASTFAAAKDFARGENATLFMVLLAAFKAVLHRYTGADDVVVGSPIAGRNRAEVEKLIGFFVNTLVLRTGIDGTLPFRELVARVRQVCVDAYAQQDAPFDKLVEVVRPQRDRSHHPLFQVAFVLQSEELSLAAFRSLQATRLDVDNPTEKFDLTVDCEERDGALRLRASYSTDLFERPTIDRLLGHFATLLDAAARAPETPLRLLPLVTEDERTQLDAWGDATAPYPRNATLGTLFEAQAARTPDAVAVMGIGVRCHVSGTLRPGDTSQTPDTRHQTPIAGDVSLTYAELDARAAALAQRLRDAGVGPDARVGVLLERSLEAIVAVVAIIKAGGAYVPLDPTYPRERIALMAAHAGVRVTIGADGTIDGTEERRVGAEPTADNLAYIVYTSGSTGTPKGVAVPHRGVVRLVMDNNFATLSAGEVMLHYAPLAFDASTLELWGALLHGGTIVVVPASTSLDELADTIRTRGVTTLWLTAGLFHAMAEERPDAFDGVRQLLAGGDVLSPVHVARLLRTHPALRIINGYGPTESTTFTTCHGMTSADADSLGGNVPIGRPIRNTRVRILDASLQPVAIGVPGELFIGGDGLARGYAGDASLTASKFVPDPFAHGERLYRTGDLVRWRADGTIEFLGRIDHQVKIRGFRIEPGEIEAALNSDPRVREAVVVVRTAANGEKYLAAFAVPSAEVTAKELRDTLASALPPYLVPSRLVLLAAMPLTANGKVDRARLPQDESAAAPRVRTAPRNAVERLIAAVWRELLAVAEVHIDDDFFTLGGHSLLATRMVARLRSLLRAEISLAVVFEAPTVAALAALLARNTPQVERVAAARERLQSMSADDVARLARRRKEGTA
jgi:amino acid adenylation domain-containing protein